MSLEWTVTEKGHRLARIYGEGDLLVGEALARGLLDGLSAPEVAALLSTVVYESRERVPLTGGLPTSESAERYDQLQRLWRRIRRVEDDHGVHLCRELDAGFAPHVFHWAEGKPLEDVLQETDMAPGDFVRTCRQLVDLIRQIEPVAPPESRAAVVAAREAVLRGVVAYTGM